MNLIIFDLSLLVIFLIAMSLFLYRNKKNLKREGLLFLYRTPWGIKLINTVGNRYKKTLKVLSYISVGLGYVLMVSVLYFILKLVWIYLFNLEFVKAVKIPPIMPLVPYVDKLVPGLPTFYFAHWIIILAIIAITHEFAHGIFAVYNKIKVKKTGFGFFPFFLPIFLAAFVELDEKKMQKIKKFPQMAILSAGTFANFLTAIFFMVVMILFFSLAFEPAGVIFDDYAYSFVPIVNITMVNNLSLDNPSYEEVIGLKNNESFDKVKVGEKEYFAIKGFTGDETNVALYENAPAISSNLQGAIIEIDGVSTKSFEELNDEISKKTLGSKMVVTTKTEEGVADYEIVVGESPFEEGRSWLGVMFQPYKTEGLGGKVASFVASFKNKNVYYESKFNEASTFIYDLLWWIVLISISVALINMLPVGIFDGGRFFYLTVLAITKSEKKAKKAFKLSTYFFLFVLFLIMFAWAISFFR